MKHVIIHTDGGSRGNPGPAASGAVLSVDGEVVAEISRFLGVTTNNQAEYMGAIIGLEKAKEMGFERVEIVMDSELAVKQLNREYKVKEPGIAQRFLEVWNLAQFFQKVTFRHVKREHNKAADALVNKCLDEQVV